MKKYLFLILLSLFSLVVIAQTKPSAGDGSKEKPYKIGNAQELLWFAGVVNGTLTDVPKDTLSCAELTADIDLSSVCGEEIGSWNPIGFSGNSYSGTFDGKGYGIKNLYATGTSTLVGLGLFGNIKSATISDLSMLSGSIISSGSNIGSIAGTVYMSTIINCHNYIPISGGKFAGGVVGYASKSSIVKCHNEVNIKSYSNNGCGGICGCNYGSEVSYCYNVADIVCEAGRVGGIVGSLEFYGIIHHCFSIGSVTGSAQGGIYGYAETGMSSESKDNYFNSTTGRESTFTRFKKMDAFANGEVCYLLNAGSEVPVFFQSIGVDKYPVLNGNEVVVKDEDKYYNVSLSICEHGDSTYVDPTCTSCGLLYCTKCHKLFDTVPALGHDTTIIVTKPTCTKIGYSTAKCSVCGLIISRSDSVPALGHDSVFNHHQDADCSFPEYDFYDCSRCGSSLSVLRAPNLGHDTLLIIHERTCGTYGYYEKKCSRCDRTLSSKKYYDQTPTMEHTYVNDFCTVCGLARSVKPDSVDGYFLIKDARELLWFSEYANVRNSDTLNAKLIADIDLSSVCGAEMMKNWLPIKNIYGIFDGQHYTISNLYFNLDNIPQDVVYKNFYDYGGVNVGLISVNKGIVKNVNIKNVYIKAEFGIGSIVALNSNSYGVVFGCSCEDAELYENASSSWYHIGGICGDSYGKLSACYAQNVKMGYRGNAIVGETYNNKITNCFFRNSTASQTCNNEKMIENFYTLIYGRDIKEIYKTEDQCMSGELCYLLNLGLEEPVWVQNLGVDSFPYISKGEKDKFVNLVSATKTCPNSSVVSACVNCIAADMYVNNDTIVTYPNHINIDDDSLHYDCCHHVLEEVIASYGDTMRINSVNDFVLFRDIVNSDKKDINGVLNVDIDLSSVCGEKIGSWTPISCFRGSFNGQFHKVAGLFINKNGLPAEGWSSWEDNEYLGLFGVNFGTIKNLGVSGEVMSDAITVGALCGRNEGDIVNCYNEAKVISANGRAGGIVGYSQMRSKAYNCYNVGDVTGAIAAGISGEGFCSNFANCYNFGKIITKQYGWGDDIAHYNECDWQEYECYLLSDSIYDDVDKYGYIRGGRLVEQFASGEVCYALNKGQDSTVWYQTLNVDPYPVLDPTHGKVLYDEEKGVYYNYPDIIYTAVDQKENEKEPVSLVAFAVNRQVIVVGVDSFRIVDMLGHDVTAQNGSLANGVYIVVFDNRVAKVIIK
jgi:hypothetical protein